MPPRSETHVMIEKLQFFARALEQLSSYSVPAQFGVGRAKYFDLAREWKPRSAYVPQVQRFREWERLCMETTWVYGILITYDLLVSLAQEVVRDKTLAFYLLEIGLRFYC